MKKLFILFTNPSQKRIRILFFTKIVNRGGGNLIVSGSTGMSFTDEIDQLRRESNQLTNENTMDIKSTIYYIKSGVSGFLVFYIK